VVDRSWGLVGREAIEQSVGDVPFLQRRRGKIVSRRVCVDGLVQLELVDELESVIRMVAWMR